MAEGFDQMLSEKMKGASLQEVMPGFDREAVWNDLNNRLQQQQKKKTQKVWWTHAAAVAAGVLLGVVLLRSLQGNEHGIGETRITNTHKHLTPPAVLVKRDTIFLMPETASIQRVATLKTEKTIVQQQFGTAPQTIAATTQVTDTQQPERGDEQERIAIVQPEKVKAVHLLDIDNENRQTALYHNAPAIHYRTSFVLQISAQRLPYNNPKQQPRTLIKELIK